MFTGIVQSVGRIEQVLAGAGAVKLLVDPGSMTLDDVAIGDSIAVSGCCLTVVALEPAASAPRLAFDVSHATLACTTGLDRRGSVNLEKAMRLSDRLGGHLVSGHVDGVGVVVANEPVARDGASDRRFVIDAPADVARFVAAKGSIAVAGVSLTVNAVAGMRVEVNRIPHTLDATTPGALRAGDRVNLEIDLIARYVARLTGFADSIAASAARKE
jgi:riboflavin synthase